MANGKWQMADCSADGLARGPAVRDQKVRERNEMVFEIMGPVKWGAGVGTGWAIMGPVNAGLVAEGWSRVLGPVNWGREGGADCSGNYGTSECGGWSRKGGAEFWDQ